MEILGYNFTYLENAQDQDWNLQFIIVLRSELLFKTIFGWAFKDIIVLNNDTKWINKGWDLRYEVSLSCVQDVTIKKKKNIFETVCITTVTLE